MSGVTTSADRKPSSASRLKPLNGTARWSSSCDRRSTWSSSRVAGAVMARCLAVRGLRTCMVPGARRTAGATVRWSIGNAGDGDARMADGVGGCWQSRHARPWRRRQQHRNRRHRQRRQLPRRRRRMQHGRIPAVRFLARRLGRARRARRRPAAGHEPDRAQRQRLLAGRALAQRARQRRHQPQCLGCAVQGLAPVLDRRRWRGVAARRRPAGRRDGDDRRIAARAGRRATAEDPLDARAPTAASSSAGKPRTTPARAGRWRSSAVTRIRAANSAGKKRARPRSRARGRERFSGRCRRPVT